MADGRKVQYLIELLPDTKQFEKIREKMKAIDGGEFIKFNPSEVKKLKGILQGIVDDVGSRASSIGTKIQQGITSGIDKNKLQKMLDLDTSKLRETMEIVEKLTGLIDDHSKGSSWLKDGKGFLGKLSSSQQDLKNLEQSISQLELKFEGLDASLTSIIKKFETLATTIRSLQSNGKPIVVSPINITTDIKGVQQFEKEISDLNTLLTEISDKNIKINTNNAARDFHKLVKEADKLSEEIDDLAYDIDAPGLSKDDERGFKMQIAQKKAQLAQMYREMDAMNQHYQKTHSGLSLFDDEGVLENPKDIIKQAKDYIKSVITELSATTKDSATKSNNAIGVEVALPSVDEIKRKLNSVIDQLNKPNSLHKIKLEIDDTANVIEDKTKRQYGSNEAIEDVNADQLVTKTEARFDRIAKSIKDKQGVILTNTKEWRQQMLEQFKFKSGDFEFNFNNNLIEELQSLFDEYGLKINIDPTYLADQIKTVLEGNNVSLGGGTANIDQASMTAAVMAGVKAALLGGELPNISIPTSGQERITDATEQTATEIEQVAKHLDIAEEYVQDVVAKIKAVAKYAVKPTDKDTAGTKSTREKFKLWGIDLEKVLGATDDSQIASMLENSLLKRGDFNKLVGSTAIDQLSSFKGSSSQTIPAFVESLREMFYMLQEDTQTVDEWTRKKDSRSIFDYAQKRAKAADSLRGVRSSIRMGKTPDIEYIDKAIEAMSAIGKNTDSLEALKLAREKLGGKTDKQSIQEFDTVANDFYKSTTKVFHDIKKHAEEAFKGTVYLQGSKKGIVKKQNIENYKQLARIGDNDVILDIRVTSSLNNVALGTTKSKYKDRISPREEQRLMRGQKADYLVSSEYEQDILRRELTYGGFKPQGAPTTDVNLDATLESGIKNREVLIAGIKANEEVQKLLREDIDALDKQIADLTAKNDAIPQSRKNATQRKIAEREAQSSQLANEIFWLEEQVGNGKDGDEQKVGSLTREIEEQLSKRASAERQLAELSELDVERRKKSLTNKITEIESKDIPELHKELEKAQTRYSIADSDKVLAQVEVLKAQSALKAVPKGKINDAARAEATERVTKANRELARATEAFETASQDVDAITSQIENSKRKIENLKSQVSETTLETIRQEQIARIQAIDNAITSLEEEFAKKSAEKTTKETELSKANKSLERARNDVVSRTQRELDEAIANRSDLVVRDSDLNRSNKDKQEEINRLELLNQRVEAEKEYNTLQEKSLMLQGSLTKLEQDGTTDDVLSNKRAELEKINTDLTEALEKVQKLGGFIGQREVREYTDAERKAYALEQLKSIDDDLITARAQKSVTSARISKKDREIAELDRWGLGAGIGASTLNREKYKATSEFMDSDYMRTIQESLREETKRLIAAAEQVNKETFDKKVSDAMIKDGMNPWDQKQVGQFLETDRGQQYSKNFADQMEADTKAIWSQYDERIKTIRNQILAEFKESMQVEDGVLSYVTKIKDENGKWINEIVQIYVRDALRERLATAKEILEEDQAPIQANIDRFEADRKTAIEYGGVSDKEILSTNIVEDWINKEKLLADEQDKRAESLQKISDLEKAGVADSDESIKQERKKLAETEKQIARLEMIIRGRQKLVDLRWDESKADQYTSEEKELHFTEQLVNYNQKIETSLARQEELKKKIESASEEEKTKLQYKLSQEEANVTKWRGSISTLEGKLQNVANEKTNTSGIKVTDASSSGIVGLIKEAVGNVDINLTPVVEILNKILAILSGNGSVTPTKNVAKQEASNWIATMSENERKAAIKQANSYDKEQVKKWLSMSDDELISTMKSLIGDMNALNKDTIEYVQKQRELGRVLNAYKDKSAFKADATSKNGKYINPRILTQKDSKLGALGLYGEHTPITSDRAVRDMFNNQQKVSNPKASSKSSAIFGGFATENTLANILEVLRKISSKGIPKGSADASNSDPTKSKNKSKTNISEVRTAIKQHDDMETRGVLGDDALEMVQNYKQEYNKLIAKEKEFSKQGTLYDPENQKTLQNMAIQVKSLGKELDKANNEAEQLEQLVNNSNTYNGKKFGQKEYVDASDDKQLEALMRSRLESLGAYNIKMDHIHKKATATARINNKVVTDLEVKYSDLTGAMYTYQKAEKESLTGIPAFLNGFKKKFNSIMQYISMTASIHRVFAELRRGVQYIKEIDLALTELKKVTDKTEATYDEFLKTAAKTGAKLGTTISAVTEATATFAKLGYSMEQSTEMAESAIVYKNVGDNIASTEDAANSIISTMKGFRLEASESMAIVDRFNEVGNRFAITSQGIGEALRLSASALSEGGNSLDESIGLITAANEVVNDPSSVGTALKTLTLRLRGSKTELEEMGEDVSDMATTTSQLQAKLLALTGGQVDIMLDENTFKNSTQILREMAAAWEDMNDIQRASALELMGGKRQANILSALIQNFDTVEKVIETSANSAGSALKENERYLDSIQGKIDQFTNSIQAMWSNFLDADVVKRVVEFGTNLIKIVDTLGLIPSILIAIASFKALTSLFKGVDILGFIKSLGALTMGTKVFEAETRKASYALIGEAINTKLAGTALVDYAIKMGLASTADVAKMTTGQLLALNFKALGVAIWGATKAVAAFLFTNPVGWIILAIGVIVGGIAAWNKWGATTENLREKLSDLKSEISDVKSEIESLNDELETTRERMAELLSKDSLSFIEQEELENLQKQNDLLEREIYLLEQRDKRLQREAQKTFDDAMDNETALIDKDNDGEKDVYNSDFEYNIVKYEKALDAYEKAKQNLVDAEKSEDEKSIKKAEKKLAKAEKRLNKIEGEVDETLNEYLTDAEGIDYASADTETRKYLDYIYNTEGKLNILRGGKQAKSMEIKRIFDKSDMANVSAEIDTLVENLIKTPGDKTIIAQISEQCKLAEKDLKAVGLSVQDATDYFTLFASEANYTTISGKIKEVDEATKRLKTSLSGFDTSSLDSVKQALIDKGWVDTKGNLMSDTIAEYFGGENGGISEKTRAEIERLVKQIYDGKIKVEDALKQFELFSVQSTLDIYIGEVQTNFKDVFPDLDGADGLINTFEELGQAIGSAAGALETFNQAEAEMAYGGQVSIETALKLMEYTDDYGSVLEVVDGKLQLAKGAEDALIESRIENIKVSAQAALENAKAASEKAWLAVADYKAAMQTEASTEVVASAWDYTLAKAAGFAAGIRSLFSKDETWSEAYNNAYNEAMSKVSEYETKYTDAGLQALVDEAEKADKDVVVAQGNVDIASKLTKDNLESIYDSETASGGNDTVDEVEDDRFQKEMDYWENRIAANQAKYEQLQNEIDLMEAKGQKADTSFYEEQLRLTEERRKLLEGEDGKGGQKGAALAYLKELEAAGKEGSEEWWEVANTLNDIESELDDVTASIVDLQDAIGEIDTYKFEEFNNRLDNLTSKLETIRNLIAPDGEEDWFDDEGNWTEAGVSVLGSRIQELEMYKQGYQETMDELAKYEPDYERNKPYYETLGIHSEQEYYEKTEELISQQYDFAESINDTEQSIVDMYESSIDAVEEYVDTLIDGYNDYIDSVKEALDAERELYDFKNNVKKQAKDIAEIERRIMSLSGSTNAADIAERRRLEADLYGAREELDNTYYDHAKESQQNALDTEAEAYEENMTRFVEGLRISLEEATLNMDEFLMGVTSMVMYNADTVLAKYEETNLPLTTELTNPWIKAKEAVGTYSGDALALMNKWTESGGFFEQFSATGTTNMQSPWTAGTNAANTFKTSVSSVMSNVVSNISSNVKTASAQLSTLYQQIQDTEKRAANVNVSTGSGGGGTGGSTSAPRQYTVTATLDIGTEKFTATGVHTSEAQAKKNAEASISEQYYNYHRYAQGKNDDQIYSLWSRTKKNIKYYAKGTLGTKRDGFAITDESWIGEEITLAAGKNGQLQYLKKGSSVLPADISANLIEWGKLDPNMLDITNPTANINMINNAINKPEIIIDVENFLKVDRVDKDTLPQLEAMMDKKIDAFAKQLNYSVKKFAR